MQTYLTGDNTKIKLNSTKVEEINTQKIKLFRVKNTAKSKSNPGEGKLSPLFFPCCPIPDLLSPAGHDTWFAGKCPTPTVTPVVDSEDFEPSSTRTRKIPLRNVSATCLQGSLSAESFSHFAWTGPSPPLPPPDLLKGGVFVPRFSPESKTRCSVKLAR